MFKKKCHLEICEECGRPKDILLKMYEEINSFKSEVESLKSQISELLSILGLRKKNITEILADDIFGKNELFVHFKKKE